MVFFGTKFQKFFCLEKGESSLEIQNKSKRFLVGHFSALPNPRFSNQGKSRANSMIDEKITVTFSKLLSPLSPRRGGIFQICFFPLHAEGAKTFQSTFYPLSTLRGLSPVRFLSPLQTQGGLRQCTYSLARTRTRCGASVKLQSRPCAVTLQTLSLATVSVARGHTVTRSSSVKAVKVFNSNRSISIQGDFSLCIFSDSETSNRVIQSVTIFYYQKTVREF